MNNTIKTIAMTILLAIGYSQARAEDFYVSPGFETYHFKNQAKLNDNNYGLGLGYGPYFIGAYKNSYNRTSEYAGYELSTHYPIINVGLGVGAITGYGPIKPLIVPEVKFTPIKRLTVAFIVAPRTYQSPHGLISMQLRIKL